MELTELIALGDITKVKALFKERSEIVEESIKQYDVATHVIMDRADKKIKNDEVITSWNLPIAYQKKIVQSAVAFLLGKPITIKQESDGTDEVFKVLTDIFKSMRMPAKDQENARIMLSETESAKLFVPYKDGSIDSEEKLKVAGVAKLKCILLARSLGDILHTLFDEFGVLKAVGRAYNVQVEGKKIEHFDIYTDEIIYYSKKTGTGWTTEEKPNLIKKIPIVYYLHPDGKPEWSDVQKLIERREWLTSTRADNNDRSGDPILVLEGEVESLPEAKTVGKVVQMGVGGKASYLVPQMSVDMVANEKEDLKELIHYLTDTPDLSMDKMSSLGLTSGKAIEMAFFGALLKAMSRHGYFEEMKDREISIVKAFIENVSYASDSTIKGQLVNLETSIEFGNPLPDNTEDLINMLSTSTSGKAIMSQKRAVELNPLVKDSDAEMAQINDEAISNDPNDI